MDTLRCPCGAHTFRTDGVCERCHDYQTRMAYVDDTTATLRAIGIVTPPRKVGFARKRVKGNTQHFIRTGRSPWSGYSVATREAPYLELQRDVGKPHKPRTTRTTTPRTRIDGPLAATDLALMAGMGTIHDSATT